MYSVVIWAVRIISIGMHHRKHCSNHRNYCNDEACGKKYNIASIEFSSEFNIADAGYAASHHHTGSASK